MRKKVLKANLAQLVQTQCLSRSSISVNRIIGLYNIPTNKTKKALYRSSDYQTSFESVGIWVQEKKFNIDFQDGGHLGFPIRMILASFDLQVTSILPIDFESISHLVQQKKFKIG